MQTRFLSELFIHVYSSPGIRYTLETVPCCLHSSSLLENCSQCHRNAVGVHLWWSGVVYRHDCVSFKMSSCHLGTAVIYSGAARLAFGKFWQATCTKPVSGRETIPALAFDLELQWNCLQICGRKRTEYDEAGGIKELLSGMVYAACAHDMTLLFVNVFS